MKIIQKGFNYSQDGQGNRLVIHLQGCNLHCPWCSNPEGMPVGGVLITDEKWLDPVLCPHGAIEDKKLNRTMCAGCRSRECITDCRSKGIRLSCEEMTADELLHYIMDNSMMFYDGGGVTFTGGECTLQYEELKQILSQLTDLGINTAIETNGTHPHLPELFPFISQLIIDCKLIDEEKHRSWTGLSNVRILENITHAAAQHPKVLIRVPLIGGVNNSEEDISDFLKFFSSVKGDNVSVEILRYHEFGRKKWEECGFQYTMTDSARICADEVDAFIKRIKDAGINYQST